MVQVIPSAADQLSPAIAAFSQGLEKYLKPNAEFQKSMQMAIGKNPELAQQLADLEKNAPGTMERMGFGELGHVIGGIPESAASMFARKNRGEIVETQEQGLALKKTQTGFDLGRLNETINFLKDPANKAVNADEILKRLTGQTEDERKGTAVAADVAGRTADARVETTKAGATVAKEQARGAPAATDAAIAKSGAEVKEATVQEKALDAALANLPELKNMDFKRAARDFIAGKLDGATTAAMFNTPGAREALSLAVNVIEQEQQRALTRSMDRSGDAEDRQLRSQAFTLYKQSKGAGTMEAWEAILKDPTTITKAREAFDKDPTELTPHEKDILHAADAQDAMQKDIDQLKLKKVNADVTRATSILDSAAAKNSSPEQLNTYLNSLNDALQARGDITGQYFTARVGERPEVGQVADKAGSAWFEGKGLWYANEKGERVDPNAILIDPVSTTKSMTALASEFYTRLQPLDGAAQAQEMEILKTRNPKLYKAVTGMYAQPGGKKK